METEREKIYNMKKINEYVYIFMSHSGDDFEKVRIIRNYLEEKSLRPLLFHLKCLTDPNEILNLIKREIDVRPRFILCDSENARSSEWVQKEMDYIQKLEPKRSYLIIDLSLPMESITPQLDEYVNQMNVFISYPRTEHSMFTHVSKRLTKYGIHILPDFEGGNDFKMTVDKGIEHAANNGYFVFLDTEEYHYSPYAGYEFKKADELNANTILIALTNEADRCCSNDPSLGRYRHIGLGHIPIEHKADEVTNTILGKIFPIGSLITFADNFRTGQFGEEDENEANLLYRFLIEKSYDSDNPAADVFRGKCYEFGWGVPIDLHRAINEYTYALHNCGKAIKINGIWLDEYVKILHEKIHAH